MHSWLSKGPHGTDSIRTTFYATKSPSSAPPSSVTYTLLPYWSSQLTPLTPPSAMSSSKGSATMLSPTQQHYSIFDQELTSDYSWKANHNSLLPPSTIFLHPCLATNSVMQLAFILELNPTVQQSLGVTNTVADHISWPQLSPHLMAPTFTPSLGHNSHPIPHCCHSGPSPNLPSNRPTALIFNSSSNAPPLQLSHEIPMESLFMDISMLTILTSTDSIKSIGLN